MMPHCDMPQKDIAFRQSDARDGFRRERCCTWYAPIDRPFKLYFLPYVGLENGAASGRPQVDALVEVLLLTQQSSPCSGTAFMALHTPDKPSDCILSSTGGSRETKQRHSRSKQGWRRQRGCACSCATILMDTRRVFKSF